MRHTIAFLTSLILVVTLLTGYSSNTTFKNSPVELISAYADIRDDYYEEIEVIDGEQKGMVYQLISLNYYIVIRNNSNEKLGDMSNFNRRTYRFEDGIELSIEPKNKLKKVTRDIFGAEDLSEHFGIGRSGPPEIEPGKEQKYIFDYVLGSNKKNPEIKLAPPKEQLDKLKQNAMEAVLVVSLKGEEIARFDLAKTN